MTEMPNADPLSRVRDIALLLPGAEERESDGQATFFVGDEMFALLRRDHRADGVTVLRVRVSRAEEQATLTEAAPAIEPEAGERVAANWLSIDLEDDADWTLIEDRVARSWELSAPTGLLEAGGR